MGCERTIRLCDFLEDSEEVPMQYEAGQTSK